MKCAPLHDRRRPDVEGSRAVVLDVQRRKPWPTRRLAFHCTVTCLAAVTLLGGCATQQTPQREKTSETGQATMRDAYQGRFSVRYADQNQHIQSAYGNFDWLEQGDEVTLSLRSPLGSTLAIVGSTPTQATLELPNQAPRTANNVEDLMRGALGFPLPVSGMRYWLKNTPAPETHATLTRDAQGRITRIVQDGWRIDYLAFADRSVDASASTRAASASNDASTSGPATASAGRVRLMNLTRIDAPKDAPLDVRLVLNP